MSASNLEADLAPQAVSIVPEALTDRLRVAIRGVTDDIISTTAIDRADRLWPHDVLAYQTNPLSLAYGACGTAIFLHQTLDQLPQDAERWILSQPLSTDAYPPGLYIGLAGIARAFALLGHIDRADHTLKLAYASPLLFKDVGVAYGMAGWGSASLSMHADTDDEIHLQFAARAGEVLLEAATVDETTRHWPSPSDGHVYLGYAHGTCGVACFLARLYEATGEAKFKVAAIDGMDFMLRQMHGDHRKPQWPARIGGRVVYPYWRLGTAGIGVAFLRMYQVTKDERYLDVARRAADGSRMLFSAEPGQFDGMSGVGDFFLDLYEVTRDVRYYERALEIAAGVLCFQVDTPGGKSFPGRQLLRLSSDYGHGAAGTAAFLQRVLAPATRSLDGILQSGTAVDVESESWKAAFDDETSIAQ